MCSRVVICASVLAGLLALSAGANILERGAVVDAARSGEFELVRELLRSGADPNQAEGDGFTALHWAARHNQPELARVLVTAGARIEAKTRLGAHTPLLVAARHGAAAVVDVLVRSGATVDQPTQTGVTPLMFAASSGDVRSLELLLDAGASPWAREDVHEQTALMFAAASNRADAVRVLLENGAETCATTRVVDAAERERTDRSARKLRAQLEDATRKVQQAAEKEKAEAAGGTAGSKDERTDAESKQGAKDGAKSASEAAAAELASKEEAAQASNARRRGLFSGLFARKSKSEPTAEKEAPRPKSFGELVGRHGGMAALHYAARQGNHEATHVLLDAGADVNRQTDGDRTSPLLMTILNGHFDLAMELLERGADPNLESVAGAAPLYAVLNLQWGPHSFYPQPSPAREKTSYLELLQALLERGADPNQRLTKKLWYTGYNFDQSGVDETGATAFWRAAQSCDVPAMRMLHEGGADPTLGAVVVPERRLPNGRNMDKDLDKGLPELGSPAVSPLQVASGAGYVGNFHRIHPGGFLKAVRYLVEELGADPAAADSKGYTPLHNAAARGDDQLIVYLLLHGADVTAVAHSGETVADMANGPVQRIQPFPKTLAFLEMLGAKNNDNCVSC